ncbi:MAG TPA: type IV pilin protein [Thiohalobacter sp.]|nr:type IV pilin protein [Thiohalobacter sp.]
MQQRQHGFTLIELMIVVAIVGILAAIAYPSYREQVRDSYRADCAGALTSLANAMERFRTVNNTYTGATVANLMPSTTCPIDGGGPTTYTLQITAQDATTYSLQAAIDANGPMAGDACGNLTLNNRGVKGVSGTRSVQDCW